MTIPAMELSEDLPVALYRLYNAAGKLLYVGITRDLKGRLANHAQEKTWWPEVARRTVELYATRAEAATAELKAIQSESPVHNRRGFKRPVYDLRPSVTGKEIFEAKGRKWAGPQCARARQMLRDEADQCIVIARRAEEMIPRG